MSRPQPHGQRPAAPPFRPAQPPARDAALAAFDDALDGAPTQADQPWNHDMNVVPDDGTVVALQVAKGEDAYRVCRWGRYRVIAPGSSGLRWRQRAGWLDYQTRKPVEGFQPEGWARYDPVENRPVRADA
jgi:hypothetical protein